MKLHTKTATKRTIIGIELLQSKNNMLPSPRRE